MLKKVDTIENKNIDENQLMAEKIVDIINGYRLFKCKNTKFIQKGD